ncbi:MAG: hypothetical protein HQL68_11170 [Magnetococcales bacterium]|nr:hypothetical protein [Magnetococcales bacterium]
MKPQDISVLCMLIHFGQEKWNFDKLSEAVCLSRGESHKSIKRLIEAQLYNDIAKKPIFQNAEELFVHGVKYLIPKKVMSVERGIRTAHSHLVFEDDFSGTNEKYIWPYFKGKDRGIAIEPISKNVVEAALKIGLDRQNIFYTLLALIDAIRLGKARERKLGREYLKEILNKESK